MSLALNDEQLEVLRRTISFRLSGSYIPEHDEEVLISVLRLFDKAELMEKIDRFAEDKSRVLDQLLNIVVKKTKLTAGDITIAWSGLEENKVPESLKSSILKELGQEGLDLWIERTEKEKYFLVITLNKKVNFIEEVVNLGGKIYNPKTEE